MDRSSATRQLKSPFSTACPRVNKSVEVTNTRAGPVVNALLYNYLLYLLHIERIVIEIGRGRDRVKVQQNILELIGLFSRG